ncbi:MAG TPA: hypothetical protein VGO61_15690 [Steroidobacteraceae bacterium]|jgi:hypothetical protein|nr:hypothetical protein [Steroidobacteraceae bacterium]
MHRQVIRMRGFWLCLCAAVIPAAIATPPAAPAGSREIEFLRAARNGDLRNVFEVSLFRGRITLPRTLIVYPSKRFGVVFQTGGDDSTMHTGFVFLGTIMEQQSGRIDADRKFPLPRNPKSIEKVGPLTLEHYEVTEFDSAAGVFVTDGGEYALFTGSATILAKEVAMVFASKDGPNHDYFVAAPTHCYDSVVAANFAYDGKGHILMLWSAPPAGAASFHALGFKPGDTVRFESFAKKGEAANDSFERLLRTPTSDGVQVPIQRTGKQMVVSIPTAMMARELPKCVPLAKSP